MVVQEVIIQTRQAVQQKTGLALKHRPTHHFQLTGEVALTQLDRDVAEQVMRSCEPRTFGLPDPVRQSPQLYAMVRKVEAASLDGWSPDETLVVCLMLSRLVRPTSFPLIYHAKISLSSDGKLEELIPIESHWTSPYAWISEQRERDWLTDEDMKELLPLLSRMPMKLPDRVSRAFWLNEFVCRNFFVDVRWPLVATALEALIHTDKDGSGYQFRTRVAKLAKRTGISGFTEDRARNFYDMRSQLAHGQGINKLNTAESKLYDQAEDVLRLTLRRAILEPNFAATFSDKASVLSSWS